MCLNGHSLIGHLGDPIVSASGVDPGFPKRGGTMRASVTTERGGGVVGEELAQNQSNLMAF